MTAGRLLAMSSPGTISAPVEAVLSGIAALHAAPAAASHFPENYFSSRNLKDARINFGALGLPPVSPPAPVSPPSLDVFLAQMAAELAASDALFLQRKYSDAFLRATPEGPYSLGGYAHTFEAIHRWILGGGAFVPELVDDAKRAGLGGSECLHLLELYLPAAQSYAVVTLGNPIPIPLTDTDIAYIWLQLATIAGDWGNALFRNRSPSNNDLAGALAIYQSVVVVAASAVASVPPPGSSPL